MSWFGQCFWMWTDIWHWRPIWNDVTWQKVRTIQTLNCMAYIFFVFHLLFSNIYGNGYYVLRYREHLHRLKLCVVK